MRKEEVLASIDKAFDEVSRICKERWNGTGDWRTSIPVRMDYDSDAIIGEALRQAREFIATETHCEIPKEGIPLAISLGTSEFIPT